jgi:hypothetical protein
MQFPWRYAPQELRIEPGAVAGYLDRGPSLFETLDTLSAEDDIGAKLAGLAHGPIIM